MFGSYFPLSGTSYHQQIIQPRLVSAAPSTVVLQSLPNESSPLLLSQLLLQQQQEQETRQLVEEEILRRLLQPVAPTVLPSTLVDTTAIPRIDISQPGLSIAPSSLEQQILEIAYQQLCRERIRMGGVLVSPSSEEVAQLAHELLQRIAQSESPLSTTIGTPTAAQGLRLGATAASPHVTDEQALIAELLEKRQINKALEEQGVAESRAASGTTSPQPGLSVDVKTAATAASKSPATREEDSQPCKTKNGIALDSDADKRQKHRKNRRSGRGKCQNKADASQKSEEESSSTSTDHTASTTGEGAHSLERQDTNVRQSQFVNMDLLKNRGKGKSIMDIVLGKLPVRKSKPNRRLPAAKAGGTTTKKTSRKAASSRKLDSLIAPPRIKRHRKLK